MTQSRREEASSKSAQPVFRGSSRAQTGCPYQQEVLTPAHGQPDPARRENTQQVAVREQCGVAGDRAGPRYHPVYPRTNLLRRLATRAPISEDQPARRRLLDLLGRQSLVVAVVPLDEVGVDDGSIGQARQLAGLSRPLHRAAENKLKYVGG